MNRRERERGVHFREFLVRVTDHDTEGYRDVVIIALNEGIAYLQAVKKHPGCACRVLTEVTLLQR